MCHAFLTAKTVSRFFDCKTSVTESQVLNSHEQKRFHLRSGQLINAFGLGTRAGAVLNYGTVGTDGSHMSLLVDHFALRSAILRLQVRCSEVRLDAAGLSDKIRTGITYSQ